MQRNECGKTQSVLSKTFLLINPQIQCFPKYIKKKGVRTLSLNHRKTGSGKTFVEMKSNKNSPRLYRKQKDTAWASLECTTRGASLSFNSSTKFSRFRFSEVKAITLFYLRFLPQTRQS